MAQTGRDEVVVSPCPYCREAAPGEGAVCSQCRLSFGEHATYTEAALAQYERNAAWYDRLASAFGAIALYPASRYRQRAIEAMALKAGDTVLDIGCGTGLSFEAIQRRIGPSGRLIGLDYTGAMLTQAARRARKRGWRNVELVQGDAAAVGTLVEGPVDAVISAYCLSLVPGWEAAIAGAATVLRPGGRLIVLDWQTMEAKGPLRVASPVVRWLTKRYGLADPSANFFADRPWHAALERLFAGVSCQRLHFGTTILCHGRVKG